MSTRYTAVIKIIQVVQTARGTGTQAGIHKEDTELASVVVRGNTLEKLVQSAKAHLDLVEEAQ